MRISYLELKNYRRFRQLKLQFPDGIVGILGLNGSGKTTIIESVAWALFGNVDEVVRTSKESVRWSGAKTNDMCSATLEFELSGTEYKVAREMGGKNLTMKAELRTKSKVLAEGDKAVKELVEKLIGMDHKSFFTSVFAKQKELNALQGISASERKKAVLRMLRIDAIDIVIDNVRRHGRDISKRIEGATKTLLDEDGREREKTIKERMPTILAEKEDAERNLREAEVKEKKAVEETEEMRGRRDELRKDFDAYNSLSKDLTAKHSSLAEHEKRKERAVSRLRDAEKKLEQLPELEESEKRWLYVSKKKEEMESDRSRNERAKHLAEDIEALEKEDARRAADLEKMRERHGDVLEIQSRIEKLDEDKRECESRKEALSAQVGELTANKTNRLEAAKSDRKKLEEIRGAGKDGSCPTCERKLEDAYELLVSKLKKSSEEADRDAHAAEMTIEQLKAALTGQTNKMDAILKKRRRLEEELATTNKADADIKTYEKEIEVNRKKLAQRKKERAELGEIRFSPEDYARMKAEHGKLKIAHDEFVRVKETEESAKHLAHEIDETTELIKKTSLEESSLKGLVVTLEPKKNAYDSIIRELDQKTAALNSAKDEVKKMTALRDKARNELEVTMRDLEAIARVKREIESERKRGDELALLEDVFVGFKDDLIARVAPTLSELTSKGLESLTDGRYSRVDLDENYELSIEDQGTMYPVSRFSGGESDLANLSLRLAISGMVAERTGAAPINFLILDEIFGSQDPNRKRSVMTALSKLSGQFRQIFLITHIEDIRDATNYVIRVEEMEDGTSKAELAS